MEILGGPLFGVAGAGESHGPAVNTIIFGCPPGLFLSREDIQRHLDRRRPGGNKHGTPRNEKDRVLILSGLYQEDHEALTDGPAITAVDDDQTFHTRSYAAGYTTGEPISAIVLTASKKSAHYQQFQGPQGAVRPGHTDLVKFHQSGGFVDIRGGGRSSYRSTISDVIGGSVARKFLRETFGTRIFSAISRVGELQTAVTLQDHFAAGESAEQISAAESLLRSAEIPTLDHTFADAAATLIKETRIAGDSIGAQVEIVAINVPALAGEPLYNSLKVRLMGSLGGLNAAQSCEIGDGTAVIARLGSENNDPIRCDGYQRNSHGGLLGGVTSGRPLICRVGFKPTSTINKTQQSVQKDLTEIDFQLEKGRHDPCVGVRAGVTLESRLAIELLNAVLMHQTRRVDSAPHLLFPE
jgi:chorismate synthase